MNKIISTFRIFCPSGTHHSNTHFYHGSIWMFYLYSIHLHSMDFVNTPVALKLFPPSMREQPHLTERPRLESLYKF
jgi:hypothetical protein